jgi:hypothetical protein
VIVIDLLKTRLTAVELIPIFVATETTVEELTPGPWQEMMMPQSKWQPFGDWEEPLVCHTPR